MLHSPLRILADENIPQVQEAFGTFGTVRLMPGRSITPEATREADVLLIRSVTPVDAALLDGSPVRFVGSATIGTDHVDREYLRTRSIAFAHAPGSNADSVVEYVLTALLRLAAHRGEALRGKTVGIVGCGAIGSRLARRLPALGCRVLVNDPPLAEHGETARSFTALDDLLAEADVVTLHVPLVHDGPHPTMHLFNAETLARLNPQAWLINTSRGPVISNAALLTCQVAGHSGAVVLDVWEHEPAPNTDLLCLVDLATPHIAGHSYDGKLAGTQVLYDALCAFLAAPPSWRTEPDLLDDRSPLNVPDPSLSETDWLDALTQQMYPIDADDARMRRLVDLPPEEQAAYFSSLRKHYPHRRTFSRFTVPRHLVPAAYREAVEQALHVHMSE